jgi:hypothetical protein
VVEVGHNEAEALVFLADEVMAGDADVFEGYVGGRAELAGADFDFAAFDAREVAVDEEHGYAACAWSTSADGGHCRSESARSDGAWTEMLTEKVAEDAVGDP